MTSLYLDMYSGIDYVIPNTIVKLLLYSLGDQSEMISRKIYTNDNPDKGMYKGFSQCQRLCLHCLDFHNLLNIFPVY